MSNRTLILILIGAVVIAWSDRIVRLPIFGSLFGWTRGAKKTVNDRLLQYGELSRSRLRPFFTRAGVQYPPSHVTVAYFKQEKRLDVYARSKSESMRFIRSYVSTAASGKLGPKLREGDYQVPEGLYRIVFLNANSLYHLSLRVNYPNAFDIAKGKLDGRPQLGGDIMIHGNAVSIGCIAIGDEAIEEMFVLAADVDISNIDVVLSPVDFRVRTLPMDFSESVPWTNELYKSISDRLRELPQPNQQ